MNTFRKKFHALHHITLGAKKIDDALFYLVKFSPIGLDLLPSAEAPTNLVVDFYLDRLAYVATIGNNNGLTGYIEPSDRNIAEITGTIKKIY